jgi:acyl-coenzyme A thioesterase PaaI-like protein
LHIEAKGCYPAEEAVELMPDSMDSTETKADDDSGSPALRARVQTGCFVCGQDNPYGLRVCFVLERDGAISAEWRPSEKVEGFKGIVHGGIISAVLDEAMSKAVAAMKYQALTGELRVRFRRHVSAGENLRIRGWVVEKTKRLIRAESMLTGTDGSERAHAWACFLALPGPAPAK